MRTTIEISDRHRGLLLSMAAERGLKGYSRIIEEALDYYIDHQRKATQAKKNILKMKGSWSSREIKDLRTKLGEVRKNWKPL